MWKIKSVQLIAKLSLVLLILQNTMSLKIDKQRLTPKERLQKINEINIPILNQFLESLLSQINNQQLKTLMNNTFLNTLKTTVEFDAENEDTFVITGDIKAMWIRDSSFQVQPYIGFMNQDESGQLKLLIKYLINRQQKCLKIDLYANAFNKDKQSYGDASDISKKIENGNLIDMAKDGRLHERKYELDSICAHLKLMNQYIQATKDYSVIDLKLLRDIYDMLQKQQKGTYEDMDDNFKQYGLYQPTYSFSRMTRSPTETQQWEMGEPAKRTGMVRSLFRPSDDSTKLQFSIPANLFLNEEIKQLVKNLGKMKTQKSRRSKLYRSQVDLIRDFTQLSYEIEDGVQRYGIMRDGEQNEYYYAYEVDGYGGQYFMDDANLPSLLSLPYLHVLSRNDPLYLNTRKRVLDKNYNKYYFEGIAGHGVGGPHSGIDMVWPMSIIIRGFTANNQQEISDSLKQLINTTANTYFIHESFNKNNADAYTRSWFAWANSLFSEFIIYLSIEYPEILKSI